MALIDIGPYKKLLLEVATRVVDDFNRRIAPTAIYKQLFDVRHTNNLVEQVRGWVGGQYPALTPDGQLPPDMIIDIKPPIKFEIDQYRLATRISATFMEVSSAKEIMLKVSEIQQQMLTFCHDAMELHGASVFLKAFDSSVTIPVDNKPLCATDHLLYLTKDTYPNMPANPTTLSLAALLDAFTNMRLTPADNGLSLQLTPSILLVPPQLEALAEILVNTPEQPFSAENTINIVARRNLQVIVWNKLSSAPGWWFLLTKPGPGGNGLVYYVRTDPTIDVSGSAGYDPQRRIYYFSCIMAVRAGFVDWRGVYGSNP